MNLRFRIRGFVCAAAVAAALCAAGCGAWDPGVTHHDPIRTEFELNVADLHGAMVSGAQAHCKIFLRDRLIRDTTVDVPRDGACKLALSIFPDTESIVHRTFTTSMRYVVTARGYVPSKGEIQHGIPLYSSDMRPDVRSTSASRPVTMYHELDYLDEHYASSLDDAGKASAIALIDSITSVTTLVDLVGEPHALRIARGSGGDTLCGKFTTTRVFNADKLSPRDVARAFFIDGYIYLLPNLISYADAHPNVVMCHAAATCVRRSFDDRSSDPHTLQIDYLIPAESAHAYMAKKLGKEEFLKTLTVTVDDTLVALESR